MIGQSTQVKVQNLCESYLHDFLKPLDPSASKPTVWKRLFGFPGKAEDFSVDHPDFARAEDQVCRFLWGELEEWETQRLRELSGLVAAGEFGPSNRWHLVVEGRLSPKEIEELRAPEGLARLRSISTFKRAVLGARVIQVRHED